MRRGERCSIQCSDVRFRQGATIPLPEGTRVGGPSIPDFLEFAPDFNVIE